MNIKEQATNFTTMRHIERVRNLLNVCIKDIMDRQEKHDQSKLESPEVELFTEYTPKLAGTTFGSEEYNQYKSEMQIALDHHYANNRHHPEFVEYSQVWEPVFGYEALYEVSDLGRIRSLTKADVELKPHVTPKGYARVSLFKEGKTKNHFVHRIVAATFKGVSELQVNHINGLKLDNRINNLEYVTASRNLQHAYDTGLKSPSVKYVVHCDELDLTTFGCNKMEAALRDKGYAKASSAAIHRCITTESDAKHLDLVFTSQNIDEYKEINSPVNSMNLVDLLEMACDWKAASERHNDGNLRKSIEINGKRFEMSAQLIKIFENTVDLIS